MRSQNLPSREANARVVIRVEWSTSASQALLLRLTNRSLVILQSLDSGSCGRQHQPSVALVVTVNENFHHRTVLADILKGLVAELVVRDAQDELMNEAWIVVERILQGGQCGAKVKEMVDLQSSRSPRSRPGRHSRGCGSAVRGHDRRQP
jgi:hypothetical protein